MTDKISCPIFLQQEKEIKILTDKINRNKEPLEKSRLAQELLQEVVILINCDEFKEANVDCRYCRKISKLRAETANMVLNAAKIFKG